MLKFIKVTDCKGNELILNSTCIEHITLGSKGNDTFIKMLSNNQPSQLNKENYFFVKETVEQVWEMLNDTVLIGMDAIS